MINPEFLKTDELYFADKTHMSVSKFKKLLKCEVDGLEEFGEPTSSMLVGSYVDAYISGILDTFVEEHPEIISSRGQTKGELKVEFKKAEEICRFIDKDKTIRDFLSGDKQTVMTGEIGGVPFKIKIDSYSKGIAISDLKCMATIRDRSGKYYDFISAWGYNYQGAIYQEIIRQNTGEQLPFFIVVVTKESPIDSAIIQIPQHILDKSLYEVELTSRRYYDIMNGDEVPIGCGICKSCISKRSSTPIISMEDIMEIF